MESNVTLVVNPAGRIIHLSRGSNLLGAFLAAGVDVPVLCNENGSCGKCRVIVKAQSNPITEVEILSLGETLAEEGYRLACRTEILGSGEVLIPEESHEDFLESTYFGSELQIIMNKKFPYPLNRLGTALNCKRGYFIALDIGTTTLTGYMFDNQGNLVSHCSCFNPTTLYGPDVITRITSLQEGKQDFTKLRNGLFAGIRRLINTLFLRGVENKALSLTVGFNRVCRIAVCGNTIMQHIFLGFDPVNIGLFPYKPVVKDIVKIKAAGLKDFHVMGLAEGAEIIVAPSVSGFIGGDAVCCVLTTQLHRLSEPSLLIDLGTNGEIVLGYDRKLFAASASAGPAFEGYRISSGMRATAGAIDSVWIDGHNVHYSVIGGGKPKGICGSGAISAVSAMLKAGILTEKGHIIPKFESYMIRKSVLIIAAEDETATGNPIIINDKDVEVIQQAKAAFASGIACLLSAAGVGLKELKKIFIAGAFGSKIDMESLRTVGIIPYNVNAEIETVGNAAGTGIAMLLLSEDAEREASEIANITKTVGFASMKEFEDEFIDALFFRHNVVC
jgi:uncharacterized 2Fe-2S/4Fe-4S cluster protein (DUF4445 family)